MTYVLTIGVALAVNGILTPVLIYVAHHMSWYDEVNHRKIHSGEVPRIGGVGIFLSVIAGALAYGFYVSPGREELLNFILTHTPLLVSMLLIHTVGLLDDFTNLKARYKLWVQILIGVLIIASGRYFTGIAIPLTDTSLNLSFFGPVITLIWIIGITNAVNLIDGLDGLSGGISTIVFLFFGFSSLALGNEEGMVISFLLFGATLTFLFFNFPPAKLFMGDSGSLFLGLMVSLLPFYSFPAEESLATAGEGTILPLAATLLIIPILDTFSAILRRKRQGKPFYMPDQNHLHHKLLTLGLSNRAILLVIYGITLAASLSVYWWIRSGSAAALSAIVLVWAATVVFFFVLHKKCRGRTMPSPEA